MLSDPILIGEAKLNGLSLRLFKGSCLDLTADSVVNAANEHLELGGGIAGEINNRAGPSVQHECRQWRDAYGDVIPGGVAVTGAGQLPFKKIIHAIGPRDRDTYENRNMLVNTLVMSFKEANNNACASINVPGISCGIFQFPKNVSAACHFEAFVIYAAQAGNYPCLRIVNFCLFGNEECEIFSNEFLNQSDKFDEFYYEGTPEEKGSSMFNSYCVMCQRPFPLEYFFFTHSCCRQICDFCLNRAPASACPNCKTYLSENPKSKIRCRQCCAMYNITERHTC
jgi:O-acetyl-ADP-ribose deacetylase